MFIILKARSTLPRWGAFLELYDTAVLCKGEQRGDAALFILLPFSLKSQTTAALPKHVRCQRQAQGTTPGRHVHFPERVHERWGLCPRNRTKKKTAGTHHECVVLLLFVVLFARRPMITNTSSGHLHCLLKASTFWGAVG